MFVVPCSSHLTHYTIPSHSAEAEVQEKPVVDISEDEEDEDENFWDKEQTCGM